jgi:hypothetical protein
MRKVLIIASVGEATTGLALLLLRDAFVGAGIVSGRVAGIALIGLGVACWPGPATAGMLIYSAGVTVYLASVRFAGGMTGVLLWPAVVLHLSLTALLVPASRTS